MKMNSINSRNEWLFGKSTQKLNKEEIQKNLISRMLMRTIKMFKYEGLPDTIPSKDLELILQTKGSVIIGKANDGNLYAFAGGLGGEPNPYYLPTIAVVANPALKLNKQWKIGDECVVGLNDYLYEGVLPTYNKYSSLLAESEISLRYAIINTRIPNIVQADNDSTAKSAELFFEKIYSGEDTGVVTTKDFFEGVKTLEYSKNNPITSIIEATQYIRSSWYAEIGLRTAYNMKREVVTEAEITMGDDILPPMVDMMLECRQKMVNEVNAMYGTNITVQLDSVWADNDKEADIALKLMESEIAQIGPNGEIEEEREESEPENAKDI